MDNQKFCQSCGMPMATEDLLGTNKDGTKNNEYCVYCYKEGTFTADCTMEEMVEACVPHCLQAGVFGDAETARNSMVGFFPTLKRWKK